MVWDSNPRYLSKYLLAAYKGMTINWLWGVDCCRNWKIYFSNFWSQDTFRVSPYLNILLFVWQCYLLYLLLRKHNKTSPICQFVIYQIRWVCHCGVILCYNSHIICRVWTDPTINVWIGPTGRVCVCCDASIDTAELQKGVAITSFRCGNNRKDTITCL